MSKVDLKRDSEKRLKNKFGRKHKRDGKLQELEKQLQFAESRCGTLKQQLDYIKLLYGCSRKCPEIPVESSYETSRGGGDNVSYLNFEDPRKWTMKPSGSVGHKEDGDGPDYLDRRVSRSNTTCTNSNSSNKQNSTQGEQDHQVLKAAQSKARCHVKLQKVKKRNSKKIKRRRRTDDGSSSKFSNVSSQTQSQVWQDPVVEIYKNAAVNAESESGLEIFATSKKKMKNTSQAMLEPKKVAEYRDGDDWRDEGERVKAGGKKPPRDILKEEGIQTEISLETLMAMSKASASASAAAAAMAPDQSKDPSTNVASDPVLKPEATFFEPPKSYCQPTISSKRKQVGRDAYSSLHNMKVRSIPFIAAKSTTPSHNIGVNIQQVLSIMKKRHHPGSENPVTSNESTVGHATDGNRLTTLFGSKRAGFKDIERISEGSAAPTGSSQSRKRPGGPSKSSMSHWISNSDFRDRRSGPTEEDLVATETSGLDWTLKVDKLKKVLVFLHEDFTSLSQKYKRLQKKLTKRNISKADAKGELGEIEKDLEKKEEEITVVIGLYKEVLNLREDLKKLQDKYNLVSCGKAFVLDGIKQSNSAHTQMTNLLRKIQNFQDQLKG